MSSNHDLEMFGRSFLIAIVLFYAVWDCAYKIDNAEAELVWYRELIGLEIVFIDCDIDINRRSEAAWTEV